MESVDRSGLLPTLSSAVWRVEFLWIERDDGSIQVAIHGPPEHPGTFRRVKYALIDYLELLLPLIGAAVVNYVQERLQRRILAVIGDDGINFGLFPGRRLTRYLSSPCQRVWCWGRG